MQFKPVYKKLMERDEYKKWMDSNTSSIFAHVFYMNDEANKDSWQAGFFDFGSSTITTFIIKGDEINIIPKADVFKKEESLIKELDMDKVEFDFDKALELAHTFRKEEHPKEGIMKEILILQHIEAGQVYNITFLLRTLKTLNVKIDASNGRVVSHHLDSIVSFEKGEKK